MHVPYHKPLRVLCKKTRIYILLFSSVPPRVDTLRFKGHIMIKKIAFVTNDYIYTITSNKRLCLNRKLSYIT